MDHQPTCGELYKAFSAWAIEKYHACPILLFAAGSIQGQAEKVYLGACQAQMIRPSLSWQPDALRIVTKICEVYSLHFCQIFYDRHVEYWIYRDVVRCQHDIKRLATMGQRPSATWSVSEWWWWHTMRGSLCGIPREEIDSEYHLRDGYGQACESAQPK